MFLTTLRLALRRLVKAPGFTATALATLGLCLGANLAIFAVVDAVIVRALPFPGSDRLVTFINSYPAAGVDRSSSSLSNYYDRRGKLKSISSLSIFEESANTVGDTGSPTRVVTARISPEFFDTLGVHLAMGRSFHEDEMAYGPDAVAVLTDAYWRNHFAADPNVVGKTFLNDGLKVTVVGVLPRGFSYLSSRAEFFRPAAHDKGDVGPEHRHDNNWDEVARLAPGATLVEAQAEIDAFNTAQLRDDPYAEAVKGAKYRTQAFNLHDDHVREIRPMLLLLQCGVAFLLLIGVVNLANLYLIRASARAKEQAVRQALGARAWHIAAAILTETTVIAVIGGAVGIILGAAGIRLLEILGTDNLPLGATVRFDGRVAAAGFLAAVLVGMLLAAPTILFSLHTKLAAGLGAESRSGTSGRAAQRLRQAFIVIQVALAFVLLSGAAQLSVSLKRVLETPPGFDPGLGFAGNIALSWNSYRDDASRESFVRRMLAEVRHLPGIRFAAITNGLPFNGSINDSAVMVAGEPKGSVRAHYLSSVSGDYWSAMGIPALEGRLITDDDGARKAKVCVVDEAFAARYWPGQDPIGRGVCKDVVYDKDKEYRVIGVVSSVKQSGLAEEPGHGAVYYPFPTPEMGTNWFTLMVSTTLPQETVAPMIRRAVAAVDPDVPINDFRSMRARIDESLVTRRSPAVLAGIFAAVALLLAAIGTYGVLSYAVSQRQREIGVRIALGAQPSQIRNQFLSIGVKLLVAGSILGVAGSWLAGRAMQSVLYKVPAFEGSSLLATALVMGAVALSACVFPARRASRVDPVVALSAD